MLEGSESQDASNYTGVVGEEERSHRAERDEVDCPKGTEPLPHRCSCLGRK